MEYFGLGLTVLNAPSNYKTSIETDKIKLGYNKNNKYDDVPFNNNLNRCNYDERLNNHVYKQYNTLLNMTPDVSNLLNNECINKYSINYFNDYYKYDDLMFRNNLMTLRNYLNENKYRKHDCDVIYSDHIYN